ncbi:MAG TPA: hypothetical protein VIX73_12405 [Kofleriaceae bacterium]
MKHPRNLRRGTAAGTKRVAQLLAPRLVSHHMRLLGVFSARGPATTRAPLRSIPLRLGGWPDRRKNGAASSSSASGNASTAAASKAPIHAV